MRIDTVEIFFYRCALRRPCRVRRLWRLIRVGWPVHSRIRSTNGRRRRRFVSRRVSPRARNFCFARANQREQREARPWPLAAGVVRSAVEFWCGRGRVAPPIGIYHHSGRGIHCVYYISYTRFRLSFHRVFPNT